MRSTVSLVLGVKHILKYIFLIDTQLQQKLAFQLQTQSTPSPTADGRIGFPQSRSDCPESSSSIGDLEQQALNQYRTSDESIREAEFTRLEREAQEQYPY